MKRVMRSSMLLAASVAFVACTGDPTSSLQGNPDHLIATPSVLIINQGATENVTVEVVDAQGSQLLSTFTATGQAGITVTTDSTFNPVFQGNTLTTQKQATRARFVVSGTNLGATSFTVTASGKSITIPVTVVPVAFAATVSASTPALGTPVVMTAPAGLSFTDSSTVSFANAPSPAIVNIAADGSTLTFIPAPGSDGVATVTNIRINYSPTLPLVTLKTIATVTVPPLTSFPGTYNTSTPSGGAQVSMSATGFKFLPNVSLTVGGFDAYIDSVSADSNTVYFVPRPGTSGPPTVDGIVLDFLTAGRLTLPSATALTVGATAYPGTNSNATAPILAVPLPGASLVLYDGGFFAGSDNVNGGADQIYQFTVAATTTLNFGLDWTGGADVDLLFTDNAAYRVTFGCATGSHPEACSGTFPAGTYFVVVNLYAGTAPGVFRLSMSQP